MDERVLKSFVTTAQLGSVTLAAERLNMTQPALSRQIQKLEQQLGVQLFDRVGRNIRLSAEGDALMQRAQAILAASRQFHETAVDLRKGETGMVRIGACSQVIERHFSQILPKWREQNPNIEIRLEEGGGADLNRRLQAGDIHIAINASHFADEAQFSAVALGSMYVRAFGLPAAMPSNAASVSLGALHGQPLLLLNNRHFTRAVFDSACQLGGVVPSVVLETSSPHTLLAMAAAGAGVAVVPSAISPKSNGLVSRQIVFQGAPLAFAISAIWPKATPLSSFGRRFLTAIEDHFQVSDPAVSDNSRVVSLQPRLALAEL